MNISTFPRSWALIWESCGAGRFSISTAAITGEESNSWVSAATLSFLCWAIFRSEEFFSPILLHLSRLPFPLIFCLSDLDRFAHRKLDKHALEIFKAFGDRMKHRFNDSMDVVRQLFVLHPLISDIRHDDGVILGLQPDGFLELLVKWLQVCVWRYNTPCLGIRHLSLRPKNSSER